MRGCSYSKTHMSCIWHKIDSQFKKYHHRIAPYAIPIINRIESNRIKSIFEKIKVRWPRFDKCANILSGFLFSKIVPPFYFVWFLWKNWCSYRFAIFLMNRHVLIAKVSWLCETLLGHSILTSLFFFSTHVYFFLLN